jgi:hypothetical protein
LLDMGLAPITWSQERQLWSYLLPLITLNSMFLGVRLPQAS